MRFNVPVAQRWILLLCIIVLCYLMAGILIWVVMRGGATPTKVYITTMVQDVMLFILPALLTAVMITQRSADFLTLSHRPSSGFTALALLALLASIPAINVVINWNATLQLPEWLGGFADWMRDSEASAAKTIAMMVNGQSAISLVMLILVVGVFAGFSEEVFFRGTIQSLMITSKVNPHIAVWTTALIFSAVHMQFFGFVPRLFLGAMFGYIAWWSGSVWTSVFAHMLNNVLAATYMWLTARDAAPELTQLDHLGNGNATLCMTSIVLTALLFTIMYRLRKSV